MGELPDPTGADHNDALARIGKLEERLRDLELEFAVMRLALGQATKALEMTTKIMERLVP